MGISTFILPALLLLTCIVRSSHSGATFYIRKNFFEKGVCKYTGYIPGGGKPNIKPITAPTATMPANALAKVAGIGSKSAALAMHTSNMMKVLNKGSALFLKIAPKLGPALGIFGAALGFVTAFTKPTAQDILNQANKAISKLTSEVNDRLVKMEGYADYKVIRLEKDLINREYRTLFNLFGNCAKDATKIKVNTCMRNAEKKAASSSPKFMILDTKIGIHKSIKHYRSYFDKFPGKAPSYFDVKRIEAGIISFRDYANLHLLMISTLLETYKDDSSLPDAAFYVKLYRNEQATLAKKYVDYGKWAYNWIFQRNVGEDLNGRFKKSCKKAYSIIEGFWRTHTADRSKCSIECTGMNKPATCDYSITVRSDGKKPSSYFSQYLARVCHRCFKSAAESYASLKAGYICNPFLASLKKDIQTYYKGVLLSNVKIWKEIAAKANKEMKGDPIEDAHNFVRQEYSKDFPLRFEAAQREAEDQYFDSLSPQEQYAYEARKDNLLDNEDKNEGENEKDDMEDEQKDGDEDCDDEIEVNDFENDIERDE